MHSPTLTVFCSMRVPETPPVASHAGRDSRLGDNTRHASPVEPNAAFCIGVEGETGAFKCLTLSILSPARPGLFFETPMSAAELTHR
jgi:hypothetical protein